MWWKFWFIHLMKIFLSEQSNPGSACENATDSELLVKISLLILNILVAIILRRKHNYILIDYSFKKNLSSITDFY